MTADLGFPASVNDIVPQDDISFGMHYFHHLELPLIDLPLTLIIDWEIFNEICDLLKAVHELLGEIIRNLIPIELFFVIKDI